jgi:hypothetical protein
VPAAARASSGSDGRLGAPPWPIVLTTNYDDLYVAAAQSAHLDRNPRLHDAERLQVPLLLLGRSASDCQRVLTSLRRPDVPILWTLQGFVGGQALARGAPRADNGRNARYRDVVQDADYGRRSRAL